MTLRLAAFVVLEEFRCHLCLEADEFLILCHIAFYSFVSLAEQMATQHLAEPVLQIVPPLRQSLGDGSLFLGAFAQQVIVDGAAGRHREHHMAFGLLHGFVNGRDTQAALARHEEAHDLGQRAKVEFRKPAGNLDHLRREPAFFIDGRQDILERPFRLLVKLRGAQHEAFDLASAERHKNAPADSKISEFSWHTVRIGFGDTLDGYIHENISRFHKR